MSTLNPPVGPHDHVQGPPAKLGAAERAAKAAGFPSDQPVFRWRYTAPPSPAVRIVDRARIREAQDRGVFDDLPEAGKPLPGIDEPYDSRWYVKRKLRDE